MKKHFFSTMFFFAVIIFIIVLVVFGPLIMFIKGYDYSSKSDKQTTSKTQVPSIPPYGYYFQPTVPPIFFMKSNSDNNSHPSDKQGD